MDFTLKRLEEMIKFTMQRHSVLLSNLANSDTPQYRAKDIKFESVFDEERLRLKNTSPTHLRALEIRGDIEVKMDTESPWLDGNNVEADVEMAKITENALLYQTTLRLINDRFKAYRNLISGR
ncbi:MAG TPA: flagellar basal body rod protein FlgB [Nitrospirae bacterium]|nr:flagellar basal body rod protein FlgB [Nitrospirota bacterium]